MYLLVRVEGSLGGFSLKDAGDDVRILSVTINAITTLLRTKNKQPLSKIGSLGRC